MFIIKAIHFKHNKIISIILIILGFISNLNAEENSRLKLPYRTFYPKVSQLTHQNMEQIAPYYNLLNQISSYDSNNKCWSLYFQKDICFNQVKSEKRTIGNSHYLFFVLVKDFNDEHFFEFNGSFVVFLAYLSVAGAPNNYELLDINGIYDFGSRGAAPDLDSFNIIKFGNNNFAWIVEDGGTWSGETEARSTIIRAISNPIYKSQILVEYDSYYNNEGNCDISSHPKYFTNCITKQINTKFNKGNTNYYDLQLSFQKWRGFDDHTSKNIYTKNFNSITKTFVYNAKRGQYVMPAKNMIEWFSKKNSRE